MKSASRDVLDFHRTFGCKVGEEGPKDVDEKTFGLRLGLMKEEYGELRAAMENADLPGIADGAVDLIYVVIGTLISYGIDPAPVWEAVHAANMAKAGGPVREDGKRLKPPGWQPPDIAAILARQKPLAMED